MRPSTGLERSSMTEGIGCHGRCLEHQGKDKEGMMRRGAEGEASNEGVPGEEVGRMRAVGEKEHGMGEGL